MCLFRSQPVPLVSELLTTAEMADADRLAVAAGIRSLDLMENAGRAVADAVAAGYPPDTPIVVVAGPGNNGGDGFVAARLLSERGYPVRVLLLGDVSRLKGDAAGTAQRWRGSVEPASPEAMPGSGVVIDALFGAGLDRPVEGPARAMIEAINAAKLPVIAVDLPSGINGTSGTVMGTAVKAARSVTFFRQKTGHMLMPGRAHCGVVQTVDIGIPAGVLDHIRPKTFVNEPELWIAGFPQPSSAGHKYDRGHAVVLSGGIASTGAARLAARGALRAGAGLVTIASPSDAVAVNAAATLAIMVRGVDDAAALSALLSDHRHNAVVLGPGAGVGAKTRDAVMAALTGERAVVLDADALTSFAEDFDALVSAIRARAKSGSETTSPTILTPHQGEFARLFKSQPQVIGQASKLESARAAARASGAIVVLKGPDTVVAGTDGIAGIAANAPPWLATAGSGDVLAGMLAGLLAQGMPAFEAACAAVWLHGEAGAEAGIGMISEDLPEVLPRVYGRLMRRADPTPSG